MTNDHSSGSLLPRSCDRSSLPPVHSASATVDATKKMSVDSNTHSAVAMMPHGFGGAALRLSILVMSQSRRFHVEGMHMMYTKLPRRDFLHLAAGAAALPATRTWKSLWRLVLVVVPGLEI